MAVVRRAGRQRSFPGGDELANQHVRCLEALVSTRFMRNDRGTYRALIIKPVRGVMLAPRKRKEE